MPPELSHIPTVLPPGVGPYQINDEQFETALSVQLREWQQSIGYRPGPIRVLAFFDAPHSVGITLVPDGLEMTDRDGTKLSKQERLDAQRERAEWTAAGQFVWWWCKDYWMDSNGEVESS